MSLKLTDYFEFNREIGTYDFTKESPKIANLRSISKYTEVPSEGLPLTILAYRAYNDHTLWWIIATFNNIIEVDNFTNETIYIPDIEEVRSVLK